MTYEDWIIAVAAEAPKLSGSALKLLLHLASLSIQGGSTIIRQSDRELEASLDLSRPTLTQAKNALRTIISIETSPGALSVFNLPPSWFPGQRSLFPQQLAKLPSHHWPEKLATDGQETQPPVAKFSGQSGQQSWPDGQETLPVLARNVGQSGQQSWPDGQETLPVRTGNQQVAAASSNSIESTSVVISKEVALKIDRVLDCVEIPSALRSDGEMLSRSLHVFMQQRGDARAAQFPPKKEIVAKCLAIAPLEKLLETLMDVSQQLSVRPASYIWFVVVFLDRLHDVPRKLTKLRLDERRFHKQPQRELDPQFSAGLAARINSNVRTMR